MDRFLQAIDKAKAALKQQPTTKENHIFLRSDGKLIKLLFDELYYVEAQGNQVKFVTEHSTFKITQTFSSVLELLPASQFVRTHRSFVVNILKVSIIESYRILLLQKGEVPLSSNFREDFLKVAVNKPVD
jgi:DNA-binding LytR/AlgR family response regulator